MHYDNPSFFAQYQDVIVDQIFIGTSRDDLQREIRTNPWCISVNQDEIAELTVRDWTTFITQVIENRTRQISAAATHGMIFYLWFDEQACQLRFCLISDFHAKLPFSGAIQIVNHPESIIEQFLDSPDHDGIPFSEFSFHDLNDIVELPLLLQPTSVYQILLS